MTENIQDELLSITNDFWQALADRDIERRFLHCADSITFIGTGLDEKAIGKSAYIAINKKGVEQYPDKFKLNILWERASVIEDMGWVENETEWTQVIHGKEEKTLIRNTVILKKFGGEWKIVHVHGSVPDFRLSGQNYITNAETIKINRELEQQVYQRTKELEQKNRSLEVESSLEKVRTVAMSMRKPDDMLEVCRKISEELAFLGIKEIRNVQTAIIDVGEKATYMNYQHFAQYHKGIIEMVEIDKHPKVRAMIDQMQKSPEAFFSESFLGDAFIQWRQYRKDENQFPDPILDDANELHFYFFSIGEGGLGISVYTSLTAAEIELFQRFRNVFALAYQRFRDIQHAETRHREAQIELALERVRARTMSMQRSDELPQAATLLFQQIQTLGMPAFAAGYCIWDDDKQAITLWMSSENILQPPFKAPTTEDELFIQMRKGYEQGKLLHVVEMGGEDLVSHYKYMRTLPVVGQIFDSIEESGHSLPVFQVMHQAYFSKGFLLFITYEPVPASHDIFLRFANVFDQTYTRFLDLQKAEAQAREAQIELGLERVRARAMAMQKSDELADAAQLLYHEFGNLGISTFSCGYMFVDESKQTQTAWVVLPDGSLPPNFITFPLTGDEVLNSRYNDWKENKPLHVFELQGEANKVHHRFLSNYVPPFVVENIFSKVPDRIIFNCANFSYGYLLILSTEHFSSEEQQTIIRFAKVFEQTYTRFLDLQKSEAQAKEAQVEAALERIRSRTMGMQKSEELKDVIRVVYEQFVHIKINIEHTGFILDYKAREDMHIWLADQHEVPSQVFIPYFDTAHWNSFVDAKEKGLHFFANHLSFEEKNNFYQTLFEKIPGVPEETKEYYFNCPGLAISTVLLDNVGLYIENFSGTPYTEEENNTLMRFGKVFQQTYTRFLDLQKAETQAREAQIESGLERVRSRTMAMQSCDELAETASVVLNELVKLGIAPSRLYIAIIENENSDVHFYLTNEEGGKDCSVYTAQIEKNITIRKMYNGWVDHNSSLSLNMEGDELASYFNYLREDVGVPFKNTQIPPRRFQTIAYFSQGYIGIASPDEQPDETTKLLERFAAVFNLTYTRFNDLKQAEKLAYQANLDLLRLKEEKVKTELALSELKATQAQLIQSEKMASLGELTAGIAHEIQNPLNFVNNFSEVNSELIEEMKAELATGNTQEAILIANDIADNEQKINHHGKRADAIVKGMLQHSRASSGTKEPTDINALADEYLRLAYHGLRAKDKSFNATMKTDYDPTIGMINIVPQDIGRVILNLITNAFYAVSSPNSSTPRPPKGGEIFVPTVTIKTTKLLPPIGGQGGERDSGVEISVSDNGPGIPEEVIDKIFQPFFTTKPTGQGTGLGLSLSYDIVKAHGGELIVETKEGIGTTFIIQLPIHKSTQSA